MENIKQILSENSYKKIKFKITKTQHLLIKAKINAVEGRFILDTGASNSCIDFDGIDYFNIKANDCDHKASGAGAIGMETKVSEGNHLKIGRWEYNHFNLIIFNLSHINESLMAHKVDPVHGIIGADVFMKSKAFIDYATNTLFLQNIQ